MFVQSCIIQAADWLFMWISALAFLPGLIMGFHNSALAEGHSASQDSGFEYKMGFYFKGNLFWCPHTNTNKLVRKCNTLTEGLTEEENEKDRQSERETGKQKQRDRKWDNIMIKNRKFRVKNVSKIMLLKYTEHLC